MHTHFFIKKILALKKDLDAIRSGFLDAKTYLDIHKGITGRAGFKLCHDGFGALRGLRSR